MTWQGRIGGALKRAANRYARETVHAEGYREGIVWGPVGKLTLATLPSAPGILVLADSDVKIICSAALPRLDRWREDANLMTALGTAALAGVVMTPDGASANALVRRLANPR
jgi:hypothetical protein